MSAFLAFIWASGRQQTTHRAELIAMTMGTAFEIYARISIWRAVYAGRETVSGIDLPQMVTYAVLGAALLYTWDSFVLVREIGQAIRSGEIGATLLRPASFPITLFAGQLGTRLIQFLAVGGPVILVSALAHLLLPPASLGHGLLFLGFLALSSLLVLQFGVLCGLLAFWVLDSHSLEWFLKGLLALLSGNLVPLWFLPAGLGEVARFLPFSWIAYYPMLAYLGERDLLQTALLLAAGIGWAIALSGLIAFAWSRTRRRAVVHGG